MEVPSRFARYSLIALLDRGGMGSVYRAHDERLEREVAIKILRGAADDEARARILREARAVAALEHPNVVAVYDVDEVLEDGATTPTMFIAMELIRGDSLRTLLGKPPATLAERVRWLRDIAEALAFAHTRGVVHRDVKPENVMIRSDGIVKVLDFGIARRGPVEASAAALPTLTEKGTVLGTPRYMAPEQMLGEPLDGRADQFSWGVIAYELIAGVPPWNATSDSLQAVAEMLVHPHAPLLEEAPDAPPVIASAVERALMRSRRDRFASMGEVVEVLDDWLARGEKTVLTTKRSSAARIVTRGARFGAIGAGLVACAALGSVAAAAFTHPAPTAAPVPQIRHCTARECTARAGAPAVCRADGECAKLASEDCRVASAPGDVGDDRTIWLGAMFPLTGPDAEGYGLREFRAVDLARGEIARVMGGSNTRADHNGTRPLGLVACDDAVAPSRAVHHLVDDVGVPAVIGFRTSQEAIDLASSTLLPKGVLGLSALNTSPMLTRLPRPPGQPRLIWRTAVSAAQSALAAAAVVPGVLEPMVHADAPTSRAPVRVALLRQDDAAGQGFADALFRALEFNGRSAVENGASFEEIIFPFSPASDAGSDAPYVEAAAKAAAFAPQIIVYFGADETFSRVLAPLEQRWPSRAPRPRYLKPAVFGPPIRAFVGRDAERRRRFFGLTSTSSSIANARFVARYNEAFDDRVTRTFSPNSSYDAFYVLAYATYAAHAGDRAGGAPITGASLSRAIPRLLPPGDAVDVGPEGIFPALEALAEGRNVDLSGATGRLDLDPETGESTVDMAVLCLGMDERGAAADSLESGAVFDSATKKLRGAVSCP